jgi:hypothetical protein
MIIKKAEVLSLLKLELKPLDITKVARMGCSQLIYTWVIFGF